MYLKKEYIIEIIKDVGFFESETHDVYLIKNLESAWNDPNSWQNRLFKSSNPTWATIGLKKIKNHVYFTIYKDYIEFSFSKSSENDYDFTLTHDIFFKIFKQNIRNLKLQELIKNENNS